jgi:hypothetical protein
VRQVLALQLLLGAVDQRLVVVTAEREPDRVQRLGQVVLVEFVEACEVDRADRRAFLHLHDDDVAFVRDLDVVEEAGRIERADGVGSLVVGEGVALLDGQVRENGVRFDALQAFEPDVPHHERRGGEGRDRGDAQADQCQRTGAAGR